MPRICIDDGLYREPKYIKLCLRVGCNYKAMGMLVEAFSLAQKHFLSTVNDRLIPFNEWPEDLNILLEFGFVEKKDLGYYVKGSESQFNWLLQRSNAGKAKKSFAKHIKKRPLTTVERNETERNGSKLIVRSRSITKSITNTLDLDPTYSKIDIKKKDLTNLVDPTCVEPKKNSVQTHTVKNKDLHFFINKKLLELYPLEYLEREKKKMEIWLAANSHKSPKSDRGMIRFVTGWLSRSWDQYRKGLNSNAPKEKTLSEALAEEQGAHGGY
jgi:hypothetical protein